MSSVKCQLTMRYLKTELMFVFKLQPCIITFDLSIYCYS